MIDISKKVVLQYYFSSSSDSIVYSLLKAVKVMQVTTLNEYLKTIAPHDLIYSDSKEKVKGKMNNLLLYCVFSEYIYK